jgi:CheY-like chemotaxis protein
MMQPAIPDFIVIDDDTVNNLICTKMLQLSIPGCTIQAFTQPNEALQYIANKYAQHSKEFVVFLDIDMPVTNGWETLADFAKLPQTIQHQMKVFVLTSSDDEDDRKRAEVCPAIMAFISKPLSQAKLKMHFPGIMAS